jgi:hypothetical protein
MIAVPISRYWGRIDRDNRFNAVTASPDHLPMPIAIRRATPADAEIMSSFNADVQADSAKHSWKYVSEFSYHRNMRHSH